MFRLIAKGCLVLLAVPVVLMSTGAIMWIPMEGINVAWATADVPYSLDTEFEWKPPGSYSLIITAPIWGLVNIRIWKNGWYTKWEETLYPPPPETADKQLRDWYNAERDE